MRFAVELNPPDFHLSGEIAITVKDEWFRALLVLQIGDLLVAFDAAKLTNNLDILSLIANAAHKMLKSAIVSQAEKKLSRK
jgi:hypothetical protein